ncbi:MAG: thioredoxin fold domain-containing protein [Paludibacteraceae bacterium]|nr:thioredoxin fold domain-containing protein [Paludibacteraceae bacterium]
MKKYLILGACLLMSACAFGQKLVNTAEFKEIIWDFEANPNTVVMKSDIPVILDFYADWCKPCKMLTPELKALLKEYDGRLVVYKINVDEDRELAKLFRIQYLPTLYFIAKDGKTTFVQGFRTKDELRQIVESFLMK